MYKNYIQFHGKKKMQVNLISNTDERLNNIIYLCKRWCFIHSHSIKKLLIIWETVHEKPLNDKNLFKTVYKMMQYT